MLKADYIPYTLKFKEPAGTSRGVLHTRQTYFVRVYDDAFPSRAGYGEAALFRGLSAEEGADYEERLAEVCNGVCGFTPDAWQAYPSLCFGMETALADFEGGGLLFPSAFTSGEAGIPINGLIWMGSFEAMRRRVEEKREEGFRCIKLKIGAIDFESELALVRMVREKFGKDAVIRLDANGAFEEEEAMYKLERLSAFGIHSVEQPVRAGNYGAMRRIAANAPVAVALDEELIGLYDETSKREMLAYIRPACIVLKPSLVGGFYGTEQWIRIAESMGIAWWITSALESNIGLNAIAQWTYIHGNPLPQGLGTGALFTNNTDTPLYTEGGYLRYARGKRPSRCGVEALFREKYGNGGL